MTCHAFRDDAARRRSRQRLALLVAAGVLLANPAAGSQMLPDPECSRGTNQPMHWQPRGTGHWVLLAESQGRALEVEGTGEDQAVWETVPTARRAPGGLYTLRFRGRRLEGATGGTAVSGTSRVNRDFPLTAEWASCAYTFREPEGEGAEAVRLGQWHVRGRLQFDDVTLTPTLHLHARSAQNLELGEAESLQDGTYRFQPDFSWAGANFHRPLVRHTGGFNSDRLLFGPGAELIYHFQVPGFRQRTGRFRLAVNHHESGALQVAMSTNGTSWIPIGEVGANSRAATLAIPAALLPSADVWVRMTAGPDTSLQVNRLEYEAGLDVKPTDFRGRTSFLEIQEQAQDLGVGLEQLRYLADRGLWELGLQLTNRSNTDRVVRASLSTESSTPSRVQRLTLTAGGSQRVTLLVRATQPGTQGGFALVRDAGAKVLLVGRTTLHLGLLGDPRPGYWLADTNGLGLWWAEGAWKIGRQRGLPPRPRAGAPTPVHLDAARGEYEPVQLVLRPDQPDRLLEASLEPFQDAEGRGSPVTARLHEVAYVHVTDPTDASAERGWYPDPLPPLVLPLALEANQNQPLWITVHVPAGARAGVHKTRCTLKTALTTQTVPIEVRVFDVDLPKRSHLRTALGLGSGLIERYHRLSKQADREAVFDKYLQNFAEHRISPYSFYDHAPPEVRFETVDGQKQPRLDFTRFDAAAERWLDQAGFNTFQLPLLGMGGGTFHARHLGELGGEREGTPEHTRLFRAYLGQVEAHLRERGWLSNAFTYWFDEPDPKDYAFVVAGMERLKAAAPGIRRMLTEQPEPALEGHVDIWCALTPEWSRERIAARRAAGEEVWWYLCTAPKAPYLGLFIDHAGTALRLWPWQSWQYDVQGLLVWATVYWTSDAAYPGELQDPWTDPMSWLSGYGYQAGQRSPWGNGDGRFLYPPRRNPNTSTEPDLSGPINSVRWECLRDGLEDYEYFWLLRERIAHAQTTGHATADQLERARALLTIPETISRDLTRFTTDPRPLLQHRLRVAEMIEQLQRDHGSLTAPGGSGRP